jgi:hypothetical protein
VSGIDPTAHWPDHRRAGEFGMAGGDDHGWMNRMWLIALALAFVLGLLSILAN